jgi:hypothetical protein
MADKDITTAPVDLGVQDAAQTDDNQAAQSSPAMQQPPQNDLADLTPVDGTEKPLRGAHPVAANDLVPVQGTEKQLSLPKQQKVQASGVLTGPMGATSIGPREHSFHNWLQDVQADVKNGSDTTWVGAMLKKMGAKGLTYGEPDSVAEMMGGPLLGVPKALEGATEVGGEVKEGVTNSDMDYGRTVRGVNKIIGGTFQSLGPLVVTQPEALAVIVPAMVAQSQAMKAAKYMGADDDTAELVGNVAGVVAAGKVHQTLHPVIERFGVAVNNRTAAEQEYTTRSRELETARGQAAEMQQRAIEAAGNETNGAGTPADTDAARSAASEAAKNVANAQKAFDQASQRRADTTIQVEKLARKIKKSADKTTAAEYEAKATEQKKAKDFFQKAVPSRSANRYTDEDYDVARSHMEAAKANGAKIVDLPSAYEAVEDARQGIESKLDPYIEKYKDEPLTSKPEDSPKVKVAQKLAEMAKVDGNFDNAMDSLSEFNITDPTVGEAKDMLTKLNNYQRAAMKGANNWDIYNMIETKPDFAARYFMADELRNAIHDNLEGHGVEGSRAARSETKSLVNVRDAIGAQIRANRGGTSVRGSGTQNALRRLTATLTGKTIKSAGIAAGAEVGGIPGAIAGGAVGEMVGQPVEDFIAPRDLTRDEHIEKSMKYKGTNRKPVEIKGVGTPANIPNEPIPPAPKDMGPAAVELTPRENTELHAELAAHYGESNLEDFTYAELEQQLRDDVAAKSRNGVALDPAEKTLLTKVLKADSADRAVTQAAAKPTGEAKIAPDLQQDLIAQAEERAATGEPTKLNPHLVSLGRGDESALVSHSPAMKAHAPASPIAGLPEGITSDMAHRHEWSHMALNAIDNEAPTGVEIRSQFHPESKGAASSIFDLSKLADENGNVDPEALQAEETRLLTQKLAGPASHEVFDGMTKDEAMSHSGTRSDVRQARAIVRDIHPEFSAAQVEEVVDAAYERARDFLTKPHIADRIKANAAVREEGLNQDYHASRGRISQFQEDIRKAHEEQTNEPQPSGGGAGEGGEKAEKPAAEEGKKNAGGSEGGGKAESPKPSEKPATARGNVESSEVDKAARGLTERTTGSPETDEAIKTGGGIPAGVLGDLKGNHVKMFHDPTTGTTLGFSEKEPVTAEAVKAKLAESRRQYAAAELPKEDFSGVHYSNVPAENGVLSGENRGVAKAGSEQARVALGAEPGVYAYREGARPESQIASRANKYSLNGQKAIADISGAQKDLFQNAYNDAKEAALKAGDNDTVAGHKGLNAAETAVKNAGFDGYEHKEDYPDNVFLFGDQKISEPNNWVAKAAATKGDGFSFHPGTGEAPTDGYMVETHLDRGQQYDHPPTAEDIRAFTEKNKDLLSKNPDLFVGGYKNSLGISERLTDQAAAEDLGKKTNQISIYDVKNGKEIPTGGTGEVLKPEDLAVSQIAKAKNPKGSSVPLMENPLPVKGTMAGGDVGTLDLTKALNKFSREQNPALEPGSEPKEMVSRAKKIAEDEAKYQLAQSKTGTEWYTTEMKDHDKVLQDLRPELAQGEMTDALPDHPVNLTLFKAAEAILSSGQKPYANVKSALRAWDAYKETGEFPRSNPAPGKEGMSWGPRNVNSYGNAFDNLNRLIAEKGEKGAADWFLNEHPVSELKEYKPETGGKKTDMEAGAKILGEKRGPFMQNLHGIESKFTADMWVSRTWNRWMGTLDLDPRIEDKGKITSESDVPRNNTERGLMKESFEKTADKLGLTTSSLQAVLWYYEQALYRAHGLPVESWSFSDAAKRVAGEHKAVPEAEQTGFNFGANEQKGQGVLEGLKSPVKAGRVHALDLINALKK